jgi:hypothetical protein
VSGIIFGSQLLRRYIGQARLHLGEERAVVGGRKDDTHHLITTSRLHPRQP